ncbi:uncharacterized protein BDR25DRAFT_357271 [Lindgomyces ingoldianus]|uniref:Uncharacterized protein n=1 Tax=Lindgomyces ingoldianus TaxID=673940 RepID=A0ACB6QPL9_9PLEO|nr:uncharacterized protein BDR25DRAFT_357271 [Lindgomyces ingoldianus]KAF2468924.1 hypothetical protein BDR25DRAFT_357271 [Lindgomyces ingoldianus]
MTSSTQTSPSEILSGIKNYIEKSSCHNSNEDKVNATQGNNLENWGWGNVKFSCDDDSHPRGFMVDQYNRRVRMMACSLINGNRYTFHLGDYKEGLQQITYRLREHPRSLLIHLRTPLPCLYHLNLSRICESRRFINLKMMNSAAISWWTDYRGMREEFTSAYLIATVAKVKRVSHHGATEGENEAARSCTPVNEAENTS